MGLLDKLFRKQKPILEDDIKKAAEWLVRAMASSGYTLNWTIESFRELDRFFQTEQRPGGLLDGQAGNKLFAIGSYMGQSLIKELGGTWETDDSDPQGELNVAVRLENGNVVWPVQRAMKRFQQGTEESLYAYGADLRK